MSENGGSHHKGGKLTPRTLQRDCTLLGMMNACISFEDVLKAIVRNPESGHAAHVAAQCLFDVRKLENALVQNDAAATEIHANCAVVKTKRIPPISREDL